MRSTRGSTLIACASLAKQLASNAIFVQLVRYPADESDAGVATPDCTSQTTEVRRFKRPSSERIGHGIVVAPKMVAGVDRLRMATYCQSPVTLFTAAADSVSCRLYGRGDSVR